MDAYDKCTNKKKKLADSVAIYDRGRELSRAPTSYTVYIIYIVLAWIL
jgi:hypothetical protein